MDLSVTTAAELEGLRDLLVGQPAATLEEASQTFATELVRAYPALVLSRVFVMLPSDALPQRAIDFARTVTESSLIGPRTPVLSLLGTSGRDPSWCDRLASRGHLAIPLVSKRFAGAIPMVSALLASLEFNIDHLDTSAIPFTRRMVGGLNGAFYVEDARTARDELGRPIISPTFVEAYGVRTVFGMGGPFFDGTLLASISFADVIVEKAVVDRFATLISFFKMKTQEHVRTGRLFREPPAP